MYKCGSAAWVEETSKCHVPFAADEGGDISRRLCALAGVLGVPTAGQSGEQVVAAASARVDELLAALPLQFSRPLLSRETLSEQQVPHSLIESKRFKPFPPTALVER